MKQLYAMLAAALSEGKDAALCSIIEDHGSAPRGSGAKMAVFRDGSTLGTVGGGALEYACIRLAKDALIKERSAVEAFHLAPNEAADIGMVCGGNVLVHIGFIGAGSKHAALFGRASSLVEEQDETWLVTKVEGEAAPIGIYGRDALLFGTGPDAAHIMHLFGSRPKRDGAYYAEPLSRGERVLIFGGGHVSQQLAAVLHRTGFSVAVYEDRADFAQRALFPHAKEIICAAYEDALAHIGITEGDYAVIMTRGHQDDYTVLRQMLRTNACYIGVIGSRRKVAVTNEKLLQEGFSEADLRRIHSPIGLPIGAETPAEIAVSIAAELILERAKRTGGKHL